MEKIRIGCSGWNYRDWRGRFYPERLPAKDWFAFYAATFDTVEINNSFYRLPKAEVFEKWREQAPPGFCYAVKANRFLTQAKKLKDCAEPLVRMMGPLRALRDRLGPILYQLPPRFRINLERLESFLEILPKDVANVFEFRDKSWLTDGTFELLDRYGASLCVHDMAGSATGRVVVGSIAYVRFHGAAGKYRGHYAEPVLLDWADWMGAQAKAGRPVWAYFNNDVEAAAPADAQTLRAMVAQTSRRL